MYCSVLFSLEPIGYVVREAMCPSALLSDGRISFGYTDRHPREFIETILRNSFDNIQELDLMNGTSFSGKRRHQNMPGLKILRGSATSKSIRMGSYGNQLEYASLYGI